MLWHVIGVSDRSAFYWATLETVRVSRWALYLSFAFFMGGLALFAHHPFLMAAGVLAFYFSVMYVQIVGFINAAPTVITSRLLFTFFVAGALGSLAVGYVAYAPFSTLYTLLYIRGLSARPGTAPNLLTVAGILLLPTASSHVEALAAYPLASVYSLLYRVDGARARRRYDVKTAVFLTAVYVIAYLAFRYGVYWAFLAPSLALTVVAPPRIVDVYGVGSFIFRWGVALAFLDFHILYMSFAVIMSALCIPFFVPSIIYRKVPNYGVRLLALALAAAAARAVGALTPAALFTLAALLYAAYKSYREQKVKVEPPPT